MNYTSLLFSILIALIGNAFLRNDIIAKEGLKVLIVTAHPDDEAVFSATMFKITHDLNGIADILLVTNGEGGYKYSTLAEELYGRELTDEQYGRQALPSIRKKELMSAGKYIGLRDYYFMDQKDTEYTLDADSVLNMVWDTTLVIQRIKDLHAKNKYDFVFTLLPLQRTHGHHKAASILALRAVRSMTKESRPIILGCGVSDTTKPIPEPFEGLESYPETAMKSNLPIDHFNRLQTFGHQQKLNYQVIVNWLIAEHKSQGSMQLYSGKGHLEQYWNYAINDEYSEQNIRSFAELLRNTPFKEFQSNGK
jgi:LmbE family N-acetylglucosaminyl deacetylase